MHGDINEYCLNIAFCFSKLTFMVTYVTGPFGTAQECLVFSFSEFIYLLAGI